MAQVRMDKFIIANYPSLSDAAFRTIAFANSPIWNGDTFIEELMFETPTIMNITYNTGDVDPELARLKAELDGNTN